MSHHHLNHHQVSTFLPMALTVEPPSTPKDSSTAPDTTASLGNMIHILCNLLFEIALPKTKTAKKGLITVETLLLTHELAGSACVLLWDNHEGPWVDDISRQLEAIKVHLGIASTARTCQKPSYAASCHPLLWDLRAPQLL